MSVDSDDTSDNEASLCPTSHSNNNNNNNKPRCFANIFNK